MLSYNLGLMQHYIIVHDCGENEMTRDKCISNIATLLECSIEQPKLTYNYFIEKNYFNLLRKGVRVIKA